MTAELTRQRAARFTPTELIAQLRESAGATRRAPRAGPLDPLVDIIVRGQNIARPLGRSWQSPTGRVVVALDHVLETSFYGARKRLQGTRLTATDADWTHGHGHDGVRGSITDLLDSGDRTSGFPNIGPPDTDDAGPRALGRVTKLTSSTSLRLASQPTRRRRSGGDGGGLRRRRRPR
jgi:hypothetical protein